MLIKVTSEHITNGKAHSCRECPIALAVADSISDKCEITVGVGSIQVYGKKYEDYIHYYSDLPPKARQFIESFDSGDNVIPFSFHFDDGGNDAY